MRSTEHLRVPSLSHLWSAKAIHARLYRGTRGSLWKAQSWCSPCSTYQYPKSMGILLAWSLVPYRISTRCKCTQSLHLEYQIQSLQSQCQTCLSTLGECSLASDRNEWYPASSCTSRRSLARSQTSLLALLRSQHNHTSWWIRKGSSCTSQKSCTNGSWRRNSLKS